MNISLTAAEHVKPGSDRDTEINIIGKSNSIKMKVSKSILLFLQANSAVMNQLLSGFKENENTEGTTALLELEEEHSIQLASYIESLHPDSSEPPLDEMLSRLVWNPSYAKLACKYLISSYSHRYAELANDLLAEYTGLNIIITCYTNPNLSGLYRCKEVSNYQQVNGPYKVTKNTNGWNICNSENCPVYYIPKSDPSQNFFTKPYEHTPETKDVYYGQPIPGTQKKEFELAFESNFSFAKPYETNVPVHEHKVKFWSIVEAVLTHDGLKLPNGLLRTQEDLSSLLSARKSYHLWDLDNINKFLTPMQVFELYYNARVTV